MGGSMFGTIICSLFVLFTMIRHCGQGRHVIRTRYNGGCGLLGFMMGAMDHGHVD